MTATVKAQSPPNPSATTTTATAPKKVKSKKPFDVAVKVASGGGTPTGTVQVYNGTKLIGTGTLSAGSVIVTITKGLRKSGKHTLTVKYLGSASFLASETTVKVKIEEEEEAPPLSRWLSELKAAGPVPRGRGRSAFLWPPEGLGPPSGRDYSRPDASRPTRSAATSSSSSGTRGPRTLRLSSTPSSWRPALAVVAP